MTGRSGKGLTTIVVLLAVAVLLIGAVLFKLGEVKPAAVSIEKIQAAQGVPVEVTPIISRDFTDYLVCDGSIAADTQAVLRAKVEEVVTAVHVRVGEAVEKGQILIEFRDADMQAEVRAARAADDEARTSFERLRSLFDQKVISQDRMDQARTAQENAAAALRRAESRLAFTKITAPIDGVVEARMVEPGEQKGIGNEMMTIVNLSTVDVRALVPEQDVGLLAAGTDGDFRLEGEDQWRTARISRISPSTGNPNRFIDVFMKTVNGGSGGGHSMRPGMYAEVRFVRGQVPGVPAVPVNAVVREGSTRTIYLVVDGTAKVPVAEPAPKPGFFPRLGRGAHRLGAMVGKKQDAAAGPPMDEVPAKLARAVAVTVGVRDHGYLQLADQSAVAGSLVIVNPRDEVRDGTIVKVVKGG